LLDQSSGASISARQMLWQLASRGYEVKILGATIFDSPNGTRRIDAHWDDIRKQPFTRLNDGILVHHLMTTSSTSPASLTAKDIELWFQLYRRYLNEFKPDLVFMYGGKAYDNLTAMEARIRGIPVAFYLGNGNYNGLPWCRDVDLVLTDSAATAGLYKERSGLDVTAVGKFISEDKYVNTPQTRETLLFINPSPEKGAYIFLQVATLLNKKRPDIPLEVVESRGSWQKIIDAVGPGLGVPDEGLNNITVTPTTDDMRPIFARARVVFHTSVWWESGSRVLAEAMVNGIPAIVAQHGGQPEMIGEGGILVKLPEKCHEPPYTTLPGLEIIDVVVQRIEALWDNEQAYAAYVSRAKKVGRTLHNIEHSTNRLVAALAPLIEPRAGDLQTEQHLNQLHKQLDD
jgi:glycosyltransferase involved in cell wall biosynthesis